MVTMLAAIAIAVAVVTLAATVGRHGALRAERHIGAWAWMVYVFLGFGMMFGAMSIDHTLLSTFMWTKLSAFILTGLWLVQGRARRREPLLPGMRQSVRN